MKINNYDIDIPVVNDIMFELCDDYDYELYTTEHSDEYRNYYWYHIKGTTPSGEHSYAPINRAMIDKISKASKKLEAMGYQLFARIYRNDIVVASLNDCKPLPCGIKNFYYVKDVIESGHLHHLINYNIEVDINFIATKFKKKDTYRYHVDLLFDEPMPV